MGASQKNSSAQVYLEPGYVLHHYPYRDTSLLVEVFTAQHGRVGLVARGARSSKSRQRSLLQSFRPLLLSWSGRGELGTLTGCESDGLVIGLQGANLFSGYYVNEVLMRLLQRQDPHPELFVHYQNTLGGLGDKDAQKVLRLFEKHLLEELGYGLQLDCEAEQHDPLKENRHYEFHLEHGPVLAPNGRDHGLCFSGRSLLSLQREELADPESLRDAKRLMRAALGLYLGERPLKTREVMQRLSAIERELPNG